MEGLLRSVFLVLACSFHTAADIPIQPYFNHWQLAGRWYPISVVMDYEPLGSSDVVGRSIIPMHNGNMDVDLETFENGQCILRMSIYWRTNTQGKFKVDQFTLRIVETDYDNYLIFHLDAGDKSALYLDARKPFVPARIREKFKEVASSLGFPVAKILDVPKYDSCP